MVTIDKKYKPLRDPSSRYYIVLGGRASGKSFAVSLNLLLLTYEAGHTILFTRYTLTSIEASILPEFISKMELMGKMSDFEITKSSIINKVSGSKILFRGIKASSGIQTANLKSLAEVTCWVLDEAEELVDEDVFDKIDESIRTAGLHNRVILIMNPTTKQHFIYNKFFVENGAPDSFNGRIDDTTYIHTTYLDNIDNLSQSFIDKAERLKIRRPEEYNNRFLGAWLDKAHGAVYQNWRVGEFKETKLMVYGQDYGFSNDPSTLCKIAIDTDNEIIYIKELFCNKAMSSGDLYIANKANCNKDLIIGDSAEPRLISQLKKMGLNIRACKKGPDSVKSGIKIIQAYDLVAEGENLINELKNYAWHKDKDQPVKGNDHILDAARYGITYLLDRPRISAKRKLSL